MCTCTVRARPAAPENRSPLPKSPRCIETEAGLAIGCSSPHPANGDRRWRTGSGAMNLGFLRRCGEGRVCPATGRLPLDRGKTGSYDRLNTYSYKHPFGRPPSDEKIT